MSMGVTAMSVIVPMVVMGVTAMLIVMMVIMMMIMVVVMAVTMGVIVLMFMVIVRVPELMRMLMAHAFIGAALGVERRLDLDDARTQSPDHGFDDVIPADTQGLGHDLRRQMPVAE